jgi:hypothetical protein
MTVVGAEETLGADRRDPPMANTSPIYRSMPSPLPASVGRELLVAWTDLLVGVLVQKEVTA